MEFEFATAGRIIFGPGTSSRLGPLASEAGKKPLVFCGRDPDRHRGLLDGLREAQLDFTVISVSGEPTVELVQAAAEGARREKRDSVVGIGGGSVLDTAKAVSALLANDGDILDYLEVVGKQREISRPAVPFLAVPTTAGTGSEVTRNAVLSVPSRKLKVSLRHRLVIPATALVDPLLTLTLPPELTAATGMDALSQLIESFLSPRANPMTDALCWMGMRNAVQGLETAWIDGTNQSAREAMSLAALMSGIGLANAGLGAVHGLAGPLGGMMNAPHGALCARLLPYVLEANLERLRKEGKKAALERFVELACCLTSDSGARAEDGITWLKKLLARFNIPSLAHHGLKEEDFDQVTAKALNSSSMKGNPVKLDADELKAILSQAL